MGTLGLGGCYEQPRQGSQTDPEVEVTLSVVPAEQDIFTRVADENIISDVNLYLVQDESVIKHVYSTTAITSFLCPAGKYTLYVIANHHADTGQMDYYRLRTYTIFAKSSYDDLPMAAAKDIEITASGKVTLPAVEVRRMVAKISYNVIVSSDVTDIKIQSVQAMRLPSVTMPFNDFESYPNDFQNGELVKNTGVPSRMSGEFYMLPNPQGSVPTINRPMDKNPLTAPAMATYIRIRAIRAHKVLDYSVYLGENSTSDFNIHPNTAHTYNIIILNDNETDVRIRSYTIDAICLTTEHPDNGIYLNTTNIKLSISIKGKMTDMHLYCDLEFISGNQEFFDFNGTSNRLIYHVPIPGSASVTEYPIGYSVPDFTRENALLHFRLNFYDAYGFVTSYDFYFSFARRIQVFTKWYDGNYGNGYGTITSPDAFKTVQTGTLSSISYMVYCPDEGCTLVAKPDPGRTFVGWCSEYNGLGLLGTNERLYYTPLTERDIIYANIR